jgi:hypothetical protein
MLPIKVAVARQRSTAATSTRLPDRISLPPAIPRHTAARRDRQQRAVGVSGHLLEPDAGDLHDERAQHTVALSELPAADEVRTRRRPRAVPRAHSRTRRPCDRRRVHP